MSIFNNAQNFVINNSQFTATNISTGRSGIDVLLEASVSDATYDAAARHPAPSCFPGTRKQYVEDITYWADPSLNSTLAPIYWMKGHAGVGKSAVAQTCVEVLKDMNQLGAAFFFTANDRDDHTRFFTSIAYQLTTEFHEYRGLVDNKLSLDKTIVAKTMASQFKNLIVEPLQELKRLGKGIPARAIFIDGLDECNNKDAQREIIEIIATSVRNHTTPFRWAFFSRPEVHIESTFSKPAIIPLCHIVFLPISRATDEEIMLYLRAGFDNLVRRRNLPIPLPWPSKSQMKNLVNAAAGLFIYAATVLRFMDSSHPDPNESLNAILNDISSSGSNILASPPRPTFVELDMFYRLILQRIPDHSLPSVRLFLAFMLLSPFRSRGAMLLANLLRSSEAKFWAICNELRAVLRIHRPSTGSEPFLASQDQPPTNKSPFLNPHHVLAQYGRVSLYHKSFYDFLDDPARSGPFCISSQQVKEDLFHHLLELHHDLSKAYCVRGTDLVLPQGTPNSAVSLSWPCNNELFDEFTKLWIYDFATSKLIYPHSMAGFPHVLLQRLKEVDYRKMLLAQLSLITGDFIAQVEVLRCDGIGRKAGNTLFYCIPPKQFHRLDTRELHQMVELYQKLEIIRPCLYQAAAITTCSVQDEGLSQTRGLYTFGHGGKRHFWYWEVNKRDQCYYEFETIDFDEALRLYREVKFDLSFFIR